MVKLIQRWFANQGACYYYVNSFLDVQKVISGAEAIHTVRFESFNYFRKKEHAIEAAQLIKQTLMDYQNKLESE